MTTPWQGLLCFARAWSEVAKELLRDDPWDFEEEEASPSGPHRAILEVGTGAMFMTAARRAVKDGAFIRRTFTPVWAAEELAHHDRELDELEKHLRDLTMKRINERVDREMLNLVHFELFTSHTGNIYRLTEKGRTLYYRLGGDHEDHAAEGDDHLNNPGGQPHLGNGGDLGWNHREVRLHKPER